MLPTRLDAEEAIATLLRYLKCNDHDLLKETPARVVRFYEEYVEGMSMDPKAVLHKRFPITFPCDTPVILRAIPFESLCEHHLAPVIGTVSIAYLPDQHVVGLSKLARVVEILARRLQLQERMTSQIADTLFDTLNPKGVAVFVKAEHFCMTTRGIRKRGAMFETTAVRGVFVREGMGGIKTIFGD